MQEMTNLDFRRALDGLFEGASHSDSLPSIADPKSTVRIAGEEVFREERGGRWLFGGCVGCRDDEVD